ncbi:MAG: arginine--tRNA ligase, partial [Deltaproteobacteria bacterium]|nr:arginine--tRNA ligase [Deltaproteobacteria bacterium]
MRENLDILIKNTLEHCFHNGLLKETTMPGYVIEVPASRAHGHLATNLAMTLASSQKRAPRDIAKTIVDNFIDPGHFLEKIDIAGPGFINFTISRLEWLKELKRIIDLDKEYGAAPAKRDESVLVEYVSANPTGPLHL